MEIKTKTQLLEAIRKYSLQFLKENEAFAALEDRVESIDESWIDVYEKKLAKLKSAEEKAMAEENYVELQKIKEEKVVAIKRLIDAYKLKTKTLEELHNGLKQEIGELGSQGSGVFKNKQLNEFTNEELPKDTIIQLSTNSSKIKLKKISDNNQYSVLETTAPGISPGDVLSLAPIVKIGHPAKITIYRKFNDRFKEVGSSQLETIREITKNPV
jgi:hypothetical protein